MSYLVLWKYVSAVMRIARLQQNFPPLDTSRCFRSVCQLFEHVGIVVCLVGGRLGSDPGLGFGEIQ